MAEKEGIGIHKREFPIAFTTTFKRHIMHLLIAEQGD
jgi:hypothetical protein